MEYFAVPIVKKFTFGEKKQCGSACFGSFASGWSASVARCVAVQEVARKIECSPRL
jgi:hypothetical protein